MEWLTQNTLKKKVITFVLVILLCFLSGFFYTFYITSKITDQIDQMFTTSLELKQMREVMTNFENSVDNYLATKSSDSFVQYLNYSNELQRTSEKYAFGKSQNSAYLQLQNISSMLKDYTDKAGEAIEFKRARNTEKYLQSFAELLTIGSHIDNKVSDVQSWDFAINLENHLVLSEQMVTIRWGLITMIFLLIVLSVLFVFSFSREVTKPISELSERVEDISKGKYTLKRTDDVYFKEASVLESAFVDMAQNIKVYIEELKDKVETENQLRKSETEKLKMENMLNQAELMALQSQINPHFLFNTLNAGLQLAIIEDAPRTSKFMEDLSDMFRYNIQRLDNEVTIKDEFENAMNYYDIMKVRFGKSLTFEFDLEDSVKDVKMPPLILQPLIENALIHGFKSQMRDGRIVVRAKMTEDQVELSVEDNGDGMDSAVLEALNSKRFSQSVRREGHTTGLGLGNVYERLRHYYRGECAMHFESALDQYSKVVLNIPWRQ